MRTYLKYSAIVFTIFSLGMFAMVVIQNFFYGGFSIDVAFVALYALIFANWLHACELKETLIYEQEEFEEELIDLLESGALKGEVFITDKKDDD